MTWLQNVRELIAIKIAPRPRSRDATILWFRELPEVIHEIAGGFRENIRQLEQEHVHPDVIEASLDLASELNRAAAKADVVFAAHISRHHLWIEDEG